MAIRRTYRNCGLCQAGGFPVDGPLDLDRSLTTRARQLACLFGLEASFARAGRLLGESAGWSLAPETLRRLCHAEAARLRSDRAERLDSASHFAAATGDWEAQIDAGKVNTPDGWRDVKCAVFARRDRAEPCDSAGYEQRDLPTPSVRAVIAEVEPAEAFGARCQAESMRLNRPVAEPMSLLGDGAEWIWTLQARRFDQAEPVLDIFHAAEHLAELSRAAWGGDEESASAWLERARRALLADGWAGVCQFVAEQTAGVGDPASLQAAYPAVANYFLGHQDRLNYAARLARGQSIGSGLIEGTIKQQIGCRMKLAGARWLAQHVGPFVELAALSNGPEWNGYWKTTLNCQN